MQGAMVVDAGDPLRASAQAAGMGGGQSEQDVKDEQTYPKP